jgi:AcrR family transcriptional regulator
MTATIRLSPSPSTRTRRTQAERTEETRGRILDAAVHVLASKGYAGLRTADVAATAGVSRGALTHHFPSRDELLLAVVEEVFRRAGEAGRARADTVHSVDEAIAGLLSDSQDFFFSELFLVAMDLAIQGRLAHSPVNAVGSISAASRLPVEASWLRAMMAAGVPETLAEDLLWLTNSIVRGLAVRRLWQDEPDRHQRLFQLWRSMVTNHLNTLTTIRPSRP